MLYRIATQWRMVLTAGILIALAALALVKGASVLAGDGGLAASQPRQTVSASTGVRGLEAATAQPGQGASAAAQVGQPTPLPPGGTRYHTVRAGETLGKIAANYGVTTAALVSANGISNPNLIRIGQRLIIPLH